MLAIPAAYQDVTGVTAAAGDVLAGKIIVDADGAKVPGTMPDNGTVNRTLDATTQSYTIPRGQAQRQRQGADRAREQDRDAEQEPADHCADVRQGADAGRCGCHPGPHTRT